MQQIRAGARSRLAIRTGMGLRRSGSKVDRLRGLNGGMIWDRWMYCKFGLELFCRSNRVDFITTLLFLQQGEKSRLSYCVTFLSGSLD